MQAHIDYEDPKLAEAAREILRRHDEGAVEANITSAVRDFLSRYAAGQKSERDRRGRGPPVAEGLRTS